MTQPTKIWKKCIAKRTLTYYTMVPPSIKEWIESETIYDEGEDTMTYKDYDEEGRLICERILYDDMTRLIKYIENGEKILEEVIQAIENDKGNLEMSSIDSDDNLKEEKLEYDERGRCIKKMFLENGRIDSWLEFEYDNQDKVIKTKEYENGKLNFYEEDIYVSDDESITLHYDSIGQLALRSEYKRLPERNTFINIYFNNEGKLLGKSEEDRNDKDEVLEQRFYDGNDKMTHHIIFGEDDVNGFRTYLREYKYKDNDLMMQVFTKYEYIYG